MNARFVDFKAEVNVRFDKVDKQFADLRAEMNARFDKIDADAKWRFRITLTILGLALAILKWL